MKSINEFHENTNSDKLLPLYEKIKKEILIFKSDNQNKGYYFDTKLSPNIRNIYNKYLISKNINLSETFYYFSNFLTIIQFSENDFTYEGNCWLNCLTLAIQSYMNERIEKQN